MAQDYMVTISHAEVDLLFQHGALPINTFLAEQEFAYAISDAYMQQLLIEGHLLVEEIST